MQFMGFTRGAHTLYLGAHDPAHWQKKMHFRPGVPADRVRKAAMHIEAYPPGMTEAGNDYDQPYDMIVGEVAGNWYDAARVYGAFARRQPWACQPPPRAHQGPREAREVLVWEQASINAAPMDRVVSINKKDPAEWVAEMIALREKLGVRISGASQAAK